MSHALTLCLLVYLSVCLSVCPSVCPPVGLPACVRQHVGGLHAEGRGDGESGPVLSGSPGGVGELWHVCDRRHRHVLHAAGRDLLSLRYRYDAFASQQLIKTRNH